MLRVAGIGPGNPRYLTLDVREKICESENVISFGRVARTLEGLRDDIIEVNKVDEVIGLIEEKEDVLLLASGDPNFYGIVDFLKTRGVQIKEVLPGLSSFQYFMSKLQKSWQYAHFLSLHGRDSDLEEIKKHKLSILLIDKHNTPDKISRKLKDLGVKGKIYVGFNLSYEEEKIIIKNIGDQIKNYSSLGVVVIENEMD